MINYGKLGIKASKMKEELLGLADQYVSYRASLYLYNKYKEKKPTLTKPIRPTMIINTHEGQKVKVISLNRIERKQVEMNLIRRKIGLRPYNAIAEINKRIIKYKRSKYGKT